MLFLFRDLFAPPRHMILLVLCAWIGLTLAEKRVQHHNINKEDLNNLVFYGLIAFITGGRASFVLQHLSAFTKSPLGIASINPDIFEPFGAFAAAIIVSLVYGQRHSLPFWPSLDALTPFFAVIMIGLGLSHLAAGTYFGRPSDLPWAIELWNSNRHPTQIYETIAAMLIFGMLWLKKRKSPAGHDFLIFVSLAAASQLVLSKFRGDSVYILNGLREEQVFSWVILAICFVLLEIRFVQSKTS